MRLVVASDQCVLVMRTCFGLPLQFERFCRPYFTAGFNAYELVEAAMVSKRAETVGEQRATSRQDRTKKHSCSTCNAAACMAVTTSCAFAPLTVQQHKIYL
jgi:hypothetical protein